MLVGRVTGNVVSTNKVTTLLGAKLLIVQPVALDTLAMQEDYLICVDDVGAGVGDLVNFGAAARGWMVRWAGAYRIAPLRGVARRRSSQRAGERCSPLQGVCSLA